MAGFASVKHCTFRRISNYVNFSRVKESVKQAESMSARSQMLVSPSLGLGHEENVREALLGSSWLAGSTQVFTILDAPMHAWWHW